MSNDLAPTAGNPLMAVLASPERLQELDVEKLERLAELHIQMQDREAKRLYAEAFNAVQGEMVPVVKRGRNTHQGSMYARHHDVDRMLTPIIAKHGFSLSFSTEDTDAAGMVRYVMLVRHKGGHSERHVMESAAGRHRQESADAPPRERGHLRQALPQGQRVRRGPERRRRWRGGRRHRPVRRDHHAPTRPSALTDLITRRPAPIERRFRQFFRIDRRWQDLAGVEVSGGRERSSSSGGRGGDPPRRRAGHRRLDGGAFGHPHGERISPAS